MILARIRGAMWRWRWTNDMPSDRLGEAHMEVREIRVRPHLSESEDLRITLHEALHAAKWEASERKVDVVSTDLARLLIRLGWRRSG